MRSSTTLGGWRTWRSWMRGWLGRGRAEQELAEELAFHLDERRAHWEGQGLDRDAAQRKARLEFGAVDACAERCRDARGWRPLDELRADLRFATRLMRRSPAFSLVAVTTLALAIGANTAMFTLLEAVLLKTLPVSRPHELATLEWTSPKDGFASWYDGSQYDNDAGERVSLSFAYPVYRELRDRGTRFSAAAAFTPATAVNVGFGGYTEVARAQRVSGSYFETLGVSAALGRVLTGADDRDGAPGTLVITDGYWRRAFGATPVIGRTLLVNGLPATIVGVTPPSYCGVRPGDCVDLVMPIEAGRPVSEPEPNLLQSPRHWGFNVIVRLRAGVSAAQASAEAEAIVRQTILASPPAGDYDLPRVIAQPAAHGLGDLRRRVERPLGVLMAFVAIVLVIACANIAGLLLTRARSRHRELTHRLALGASRARLVRQLLTESLMLSALGGVLGVALAVALRRLLPLALADRGAPVFLDVEPGGWLLAFSSGVTVATGVVCGVWPAFSASRLGADSLGRRATDGPGRSWAATLLVGGQVALSLVLVVGAGLFVRTLINLRHEALGFQAERLLLFQLDAASAGYEGARLYDFYEDAVRRVGAVPGVRSVSFSRWGVLSGAQTTENISTPTEPSSARTKVHVHYVAPGYFETMGMALALGRDVAWSDRLHAPKVAVVNRAFARRFVARGSAVGSRFGFLGPDSANDIEIVGVAQDARFATLREQAPATVYLPYRQQPQHLMTFAVRAAGDPLALVESIRRTLAAIDTQVPLSEVRTQQAQIDKSVARERLFAQVASGFAGLAVLLAGIGLYGTLAAWVSRRTPEIGLRLALGARRSDVVRMVVAQAAAPVVAGVALGVVAAMASTRVLDSLLFGLTPRDATSIAGAAAVLLASAAIAAWLPSRRAAHVDPMVALRRE